MAFFEREVLRSSRKIRRKKNFYVFSLLLSSFLIVVIGSAYLSQMGSLHIKKIEISGNKTIPTKDIHKAFAPLLSGKFSFLFPKNNFLLYQKSEIVRVIEKNFLKIDKVEVAMSGSQELIINVKERVSSFVWSPKKDGPYYYMDKNGMIFETAPILSGGVFYKIEGGLPKEDRGMNPLGKIVLGESKISSLMKFKDEAERIVKRNIGEKWTTELISVDDGGDFNLHFSDGSSNDWRIVFLTKDEAMDPGQKETAGVLRSGVENVRRSFGSDLINIARNLDVTVTSQSFSKNLAESSGVPEYIDLRFGKKVFYKFKTAIKVSESL